MEVWKRKGKVFLFFFSPEFLDFGSGIEVNSKLLRRGKWKLEIVLEREFEDLMCRLEKKEKQKEGRMGFKSFGGEKMKTMTATTTSSSRSKMKLWMIRATTSVLLWTCIVQLTALGDMWGPRVLKGWPSCFSQESVTAISALQDKTPSVQARVLPPKSEFLTFLFIFTLY